MKSTEKLNLENFDFSKKNKWKKRIISYLDKGWKKPILCDFLNITDELFLRIMEPEYKIEIFNFKSEPYNSEKEMLNEFKCTYEDLSDQEKEIFNNL